MAVPGGLVPGPTATMRTLRFFLQRSPATARSLTIVGFVALVGALLGPADAQESLSDASIEEARAERELAREQQLAANINIAILEAQDIEVRAALDAANEMVERQQARVDAARQALDAAALRVFQTEVDLSWAEQDILQLRAAARHFAVEAYVRVPPDDSATWLESTDFTQAARKVALLEVVSRSAADAMDDLRAREEDEAELLAIAEAAEHEAARLEAELAAELAELDAQREVRAGIKAEMDGRIASWESQLASFEQDEAELTEFIRQRQLELAGVNLNARPSGPSAQGFVYPTEGAAGSPFGPRLHPILGYVRMHSGLDMGGNTGDPIWASKQGEVILAGWNGGYGNSVVIAHEGNVTTVYGHMSQVAVSVGQQVVTGEFIGQVGSTGLSTGPHLHFETRVNGVPENPMFFLG